MRTFSENDFQFMREAITLAAKGRGAVSPNPPVGCVIVKDNIIVGRGYHQKFGGAHAEVNALADARNNTDGGIVGATAYVTLMPCNHYGKTPPCADALVRAGISRVVVAVEDPNPVSGGGAEKLRQNGVTVETGLLTEEAARVMRGFLKFHRTALPHVLLKYAMTLDGKIAHPDGSSAWISCERSREFVQALRMQSDAVMVGSGTALHDQPRLNVRNAASPQPKRVFIDSTLRLNASMPLFSHPGGEFVIIHALSPDDGRVRELEHCGVTMVSCPAAENSPDADHVDLHQALLRLAADFGIRDILCEGGAHLNASLLQAELADAAAVFIAPKLLCGSGISATEGARTLPVAASVRLQNPEYKFFDRDIFVQGDIEYPVA